MTRPKRLDDLDKRLTSRTVILGVGNDIKGDDGVGPYVAGLLEEDFKSIDGKSVPESFAHDVISLGPDIVLIIDATKMSSVPGSVGIFTKEDVSNVSSSTHSMPLSMLAKHIENEAGCEVYIIGIEPEDTNFGMSLTKTVKDSAEELAAILRSFRSEKENNK